MIDYIKLTNFRIFDNLDLNLNSKFVIISGKNAIGKTSILEAIYLCSTTKSHRTNKIVDVIKTDKEFSTITLKASKEFKIMLSNKQKSFFIQNKEYKRLSDFIGNLKCVLFSPSDINLVIGNKMDKRHFLDLEISLLDSNYLIALNNYKKLLKERNEILKQSKIDKIILNIITNDLIKNLIIIKNKRIEYIEKLNENLTNISKNMNIESISLKYRSNYQDVNKAFLDNLNYDILTKTTNIGIHRDDFEIFINDKNAKDFSSEGQIRTICIALKMAVKGILDQKTLSDSILLLDDVFAHLDSNRINSLVNFIKNSDSQTIITTTSVLNIPDELLKNALVVRI